MENLNEMGLVQLGSDDIKKIDGGKWGGWITAAVAEIVDVITSGGQNLVNAYNNGQAAAKSLTK